MSQKPCAATEGLPNGKKPALADPQLVPIVLKQAILQIRQQHKGFDLDRVVTTLEKSKASDHYLFSPLQS